MTRRFGTGNDLTVFVNGHGAELMACTRRLDGTLELKPEASLANRWREFHEHGRPSVLGQGPSANARQRSASEGHEREEMHDRFARDIAEWVAGSVRSHRADRVRVLAGPAMVGRMRREVERLAKALGVEIDCREGEFTRIGTTALERHPTVVEALE
jgi:protein required for attachment to host cells